MMRNTSLLAALLGAAAMFGGTATAPSAALALSAGPQAIGKHGAHAPGGSAASQRDLNAAVRSGRWNGRRAAGRYPGTGWPVATDRRMARKRRAKAQHRRACRGRA